MAVKAVIFDMDGTLIDTEKLNIRFWCEAGSFFGFGIKPEDIIYIRSLDERLVRKYFRERFGEAFDFDKVRARRRELMKAHVDSEGIEPKPGAKELLCYLKGTCARLAVATASTQEHADDYLGRIGVRDMFDAVISTRSVGNGKPAPDVYLHVCGRLGLDPGECAAVEDAPFGIESAYRAGCHVVTVPDVTAPGEKELGMVEYVAETLDGLIPYFSSVRPGSGIRRADDGFGAAPYSAERCLCFENGLKTVPEHARSADVTEGGTTGVPSRSKIIICLAADSVRAA